MSKLRYKRIDIRETEVRSRVEDVPEDKRIDDLYKAMNNKISSELDADDIVSINIDTTGLQQGKLVARVFYKVALGE